MCPPSQHRTPSPARRRAFGTTLLSLALALLLAACGDDATEEATPATDQQAAAAATATPTPAGPPERPAPTLPTGAEAPEDDRAGRATFARHVVETWAYAIATNDPDPLLALSPRKQPCGGCRPLARELAQRSEDGWFVALDRVQITDVDAPRRDVEPVRATVTLDIPATYALNDDRTFRSTNPSHEDASFEVEMTWRRGGFVLLAYTLTT